MDMFYKEDLKEVFPYARDDVLDILVSSDDLFKQYEVSRNYERMICFLAQCGHETMGFSRLTEMGSRNYFKKYDGRRDLGNVVPGDGYLYRGRGMIMLTGRDNYKNYGKILHKDYINNPDLVAEPEDALLTSLQYWYIRNLNKYADQKDMITITKRINGGLNGLESRIKYYNKLHDYM